MLFEQNLQLSHRAVLLMLEAAIDCAESIGQPQCIVIVDAGGGVLGEIRMTGAKFLSRKSALAKALTSASVGKPSSDIPEQVRPAIAAATEGCITGLPGGLPIFHQGQLLGAVGVGSGSGEQDIAVAEAALQVLERAAKG